MTIKTSTSTWTWKANIIWRFVTGCELWFLDESLTCYEPYPPSWSRHPYFPPQDIKVTLLPALALNAGIIHKLRGAESSNNSYLYWAVPCNHEEEVVISALIGQFMFFFFSLVEENSTQSQTQTHTVNTWTMLDNQPGKVGNYLGAPKVPGSLSVSVGNLISCKFVRELTTVKYNISLDGCCIITYTNGVALICEWSCQNLILRHSLF